MKLLDNFMVEVSQKFLRVISTPAIEKGEGPQSFFRASKVFLTLFIHQVLIWANIFKGLNICGPLPFFFWGGGGQMTSELPYFNPCVFYTWHEPLPHIYIKPELGPFQKSKPTVNQVMPIYTMSLKSILNIHISHHPCSNVQATALPSLFFNCKFSNIM